MNIIDKIKFLKKIIKLDHSGCNGYCVSEIERVACGDCPLTAICKGTAISKVEFGNFTLSERRKSRVEKAEELLEIEKNKILSIIKVGDPICTGFYKSADGFNQCEGCPVIMECNSGDRYTRSEKAKKLLLELFDEDYDKPNKNVNHVDWEKILNTDIRVVCEHDEIEEFFEILNSAGMKWVTGKSYDYHDFEKVLEAHNCMNKPIYFNVKEGLWAQLNVVYYTIIKNVVDCIKFQDIFIKENNEELEEDVDVEENKHRHYRFIKREYSDKYQYVIQEEKNDEYFDEFLYNSYDDAYQKFIELKKEHEKFTETIINEF
jgi:hypothetical protein